MTRKNNKKKRRSKLDGSKKKDGAAFAENGANDDSGDEVAGNKGKENLCYEIKHSDVMGRYLVATRDIKPGELIAEEPALVIGPCTGCNIICLGCYRELDENNIHKCPDCRWPLCGPKCIGNKQPLGHSPHECETLRSCPPNYEDLEDLKDCYQAIAPLRCLLLMVREPNKWETVMDMEAHNEIRKQRKDIWENNQIHVVNRIREKWNIKEYSEDLIHTVCGIFEVNAFEVGGAEVAARGLYARVFLLAHDCTPATTHVDTPTANRMLSLRAATLIKIGEPLTLCYAYTLQGTLKRREHLSRSKFFECCCQRCSDPTELGTYVSAFRCPKCSVGRVLPIKPLDNGASWACGCGYVMPAVAVHLMLKRLTDEYDLIDQNDIKCLEGYLHKYRNVLHSSHYLFLSIKHSLSQLYGKVHGYMIQDLSEELLKRKIEICRDLGKIFDVIEPGLSRLRGVTLYELHAPLMILLTRDFEKKAISKDELRTRLKEVVQYLSESAKILSVEPPNSPEGLIAAAAKEALTKIKTWEKIIGKI